MGKSNCMDILSDKKRTLICENLDLAKKGKL